MAIGKWIPFGTSQSATTPVPVVVEQPPTVSAADAKLFGLENFGNTCYANSVLQALYFCGPFRELILQYPDPSVPEVPPLPTPPPVLAQPPNPNLRKKPTRQNSVSEPSPLHANAPPVVPIPPAPPTLLSALRSLFMHISRNPADKGTVAPRAFIDKLKELNELFRGSAHQDAHEFLNFLLNKIMEDMEDDGRKVGVNGNGVGKSGEDLSTSIATLSTQPPASTSTAQAMDYHSTLVHRLFEGVLTSETRCLTCETVSSRDESFLDLSIDIEQNSSVTACLRQFSASEMLCQKNKFFCDSCCDLQEAEKRMKIKKLPNVLALHLKRFKYQEDVQKYIKLAYRVAFPFELRLFNTVDDAVDPDRLYELFAIVVHIGTGPHHGHYVTIIRARGVWMLFDDDTVSTIKESEIPKYFGDSNSGSAYVLYYQAVDLDLPALGLKPPTPPPASAAATDIGSTPSKPLSLATVDPSDHGHAPGSPVPHPPPGLTAEDPDVSDKSDSPIPSLPYSQPAPLSPLSTPKPPSVSQPQSLSVDIPAHGTLSSSPSSPSHHNHTFGGLLHTLRQTPSLRLRNGTTGPTDRRSGVDIPPLPSSPSASRRPRTAQSATSTSTHTETSSFQTHEHASVPPSPVPKGTAYTNGLATPTKDTKDRDKERQPEKKSSLWFLKRPSSSRGADAHAPAPMSPLNFPTMPRLGRRGSAAAIHDPSSPLAPSPPFMSASTSEPSRPLSSSSASAAHKKSTPDLARTAGKREKRGSAQAKLPPRPSTAGASIGGGGGGFSSSSFSRRHSTRPTSGLMGPPPLPPLPGSPTSPSTGTTVNGTDVKPPPVPPKGKDVETANSGAGPLLTPSTSSLSDAGTGTGAGTTTATGTEARRHSRSPQPSQSESRHSLRSSLSRSQSLAQSQSQSHSRPQSRTQVQSPSVSQSQSLPQTQAPPPLPADPRAFFTPSLSYGGTGGGGIGDTPVPPTAAAAVVDGVHGSASAGAAAGSNAGANWKRTTRKLSFTAPMLGFGRKDKDKERERERREGPPSTFAR